MLMSTIDLMKFLNVGRDTAYALMRSRGFPSIRIGKRYYVTKEAVNEWLQKYKYKTFNT